MSRFTEKIKQNRFFAKVLEIPLVKKVLNRETVLYVIVGVLTTLVDYIIFAICNELLLRGGTDAVNASSIATSIAWLAAVIFAYFTNKKVVFRNDDYSFRNMLREMLQFFGARILSGVISVILMRVLVAEPVSMNAYLAKVLVAVFNMVFNYVASKLLIFKKKK